MHNDTGDEHEQISNPEGSVQSTAVAVRGRAEGAKKLLDKALGKSSESDSSPGTQLAESEIRRVRRGKFFLSKHEQVMYGSLSNPIYSGYCHGVVVGESHQDLALDGIWCFAAHNDFDLIPELTPLGDWPEYKRTDTGWIRADGERRLEEKEFTSKLLNRAKEIKRLSNG